MTFPAIDLSKLSPPDVIEEISLDAILQGNKDYLINLDPNLADILALESEPLTKFVELVSYRETLLRALINSASWANMVAYAKGNDLDHLAALVPVKRLEITPADPDAVPPVPAVMESDEAFRRRVRLAPSSFSVAGPVGAYEYHALSADSGVKDAKATSPTPSQVTVSILSNSGDGLADQNLLDSVTAALGEDVVPDTDQATVQTATIINYSVDAVLDFYPGPDSSAVLAVAQEAVQDYVTDNHKIGHDITLSGLYAALHQSGVQKVTLNQPVTDLVISDTEAAYCTSLTVTEGAINV